MLRKIQNLINSIGFFVAITWGKVRGTKRSGIAIKKKLSVTQTRFAVGESYKLGCSTVTLCASKQEVQERIAAAAERRRVRKETLTKKGVEMMLMSPEELLAFKIDEWLAKRESVAQTLMAAQEAADGVRLKAPPQTPLN